MRFSVRSWVLLGTVVLPAPGDPAWRSLGFPGIRQHTHYEVEIAGGTAAFVARSRCSASAMYVPAETIDVRVTPRLRWRWKLTAGIDVADEKTRAGDDFAARVYVMFRFEPARASAWKRLQHALARRLYGEVIPGNTINYVWASRAAPGERWRSPYTPLAEVIVKRSGPRAGWVEEEVDLEADHIAAFGHRPPPLLSVAVMSDTDNTCQRAEASFADFRFVGRAESGSGGG